MSSHHVVREKQEPALLVLGLDHFPDELLGQLLEWSPTVIATADTAEILISRGIKVDWIIAGGDEDAPQSDVKRMSAGDNNLTDAALKFLAESEYPAVNIITDELNLADYEHFVNRIDLVIFHDGRRIFPVVSSFRKWKPAGEWIYIYGAPSNLVADGLDNHGEGKYKTVSDGFFNLSFDDLFLFVAEEW
jgi:thiamine pyrophosphokinase